MEFMRLGLRADSKGGNICTYSYDINVLRVPHKIDKFTDASRESIYAFRTSVNGKTRPEGDGSSRNQRGGCSERRGAAKKTEGREFPES